MLQSYYCMRAYSKSIVNRLHGKIVKYAKILGKALIFLLCLNSSVEKFLTNFYLKPLWNEAVLRMLLLTTIYF